MSSFSGDYYFSTSDAFSMDEATFNPAGRKERRTVVDITPQDDSIPTFQSVTQRNVENLPRRHVAQGAEIQDLQTPALLQADLTTRSWGKSSSGFHGFHSTGARKSEDFYESMDLAASANQVAEQSAVSLQLAHGFCTQPQEIIG
jgi:hypothetical protein